MAKKDRSVDWLTIKHFWRISTSYKKDFILSWLTGFSGLGISIIVPYFIGKILGSLIHPSVSIQASLYALIAASIVTVILNRVGYTGFLSLQPKIQADLQTEVLVALLKRGTSFHNNR